MFLLPSTKHLFGSVAHEPLGRTVCFRAATGSIEKYKTQFVTHGFSQKEEIDYEETFAPMVRYTLIRVIMALAAKLGWKLHQMDVKTTFPNGVVEDEVYMEQPLGFETHDR